MKITVCKKICKNCPFLKQNSKQLYVDTVNEMVDTDIMSPCHMDMVKYTGSENEGVEIYAKNAPIFKVCRGLVEARLLAEVPAKTPAWKYLYIIFGNEINGDIVDLRDL